MHFPCFRRLIVTSYSTILWPGCMNWHSYNWHLHCWHSHSLMQSNLFAGSSLNGDFGIQNGYLPYAEQFRDGCANLAAPLSRVDKSTYYLIAGLPTSIGSFNPFKAIGNVQLCVAVRPCTDG